MPTGERHSIPPDYTWPGFDQLPEALSQCHRQFFQALAGRHPLTLREYRRAFLALYVFMQEQGLQDLATLTPERLEAFQLWGYRRHHWSPGTVEALLRTLQRIGNALRRLGLLPANPFVQAPRAAPPNLQRGGAPLSWFRATRRFLRWLMARRCKPATVRTHLQALRHLYRFLASEGLVPPAQITSAQLERFAAVLAQSPGTRQRPLSPLVQRLIALRVRQFIRWLDQEGFRRARVVQGGGPVLPEDLGLSTRLRDLVEEFFEYVRMRYTPSCQAHYTRSLQRFQQWLDARSESQRVALIHQLTIHVLTEYQQWINAVAQHADGSPLTHSEKASRLYPLRSFLYFGYRKGFLRKDLRRFVMVPRPEYKVLKRLLTPEEMAQLLEAPPESTVAGIRDRAILELAYSGLRVSELVALKVGDVELQENRVFIREAKEDKDRVVPMTGFAVYWVDRWLRRRQEFLGGREDPGYLFLSRSRRLMTRQDVNYALGRYVKRARVPVRVSAHDLRRITATHLAANGAPLRYIQALLGHASLKVTTRYIRLTHEQVKKEYGRTHPSARRDRHTLPAAS